MVIRFVPASVKGSKEHLFFLSYLGLIYFLLYLFPSSFLFFFLLFLVFFPLLLFVPVSKWFCEELEGSKPDLGRLKNINPNSTIHPKSTILFANLVTYCKHSLSQLLRVFIEDCKESIHESDYHLHTFDFGYKVLLKNLKDGMLILSVAMLEEREEPQGHQR